MLIVADRPEIRLLLSEFLRLEGYLPLEALDSEQAIQLTREEKPAVILMDIMMPGRDGLSAIQEIRTWDSSVGIIVLTAFSTEQHAIRALQVGADDYMHKPFEPVELRTKVAMVLEKRNLREENRQLQAKMAALLEHYLPQPVAQRLIRSPEMPHLGGERQEITVLFADLRGFTSFTAMTPPEELVAHLNRYLSAAAEAVLRHNGMVDKFLGDGIMALFNAPIADENHLLNAVRAALSIHKEVERMQAQNQSCSPENIPLQFGIGIHTGEAIVGNIGAACLMSYTAVGDVVNVTKRLEEYAGPGQTLASQAVVNSVGDKLIVQALAPVPIKGKTEPQPVFQVWGITDFGT